MGIDKMHKANFDEINTIGKDREILRQIIIVDHVDGKNYREKMNLKVIFVVVEKW